MDVSEKMKYKLANAMKELLVHTPVDKITVKQIVDQCDVTRPTFYRHFKDKYDLINKDIRLIGSNFGKAIDRPLKYFLFTDGKVQYLNSI